MADGGDGKDGKIGRSELQGWLRTALVIASMAGAVYYNKGRIDAHMANRDVHKTTSELADMFVLRREYEKHDARMAEDVRYLRDRIDWLVNAMKKQEGR